MSDNKTAEKGMYLSEEQLTRILTAAVNAAKAPSILEQKEIEKQIEADKRRNLLSVEMARVEEERIHARKHGCSHSRYPSGTKNGGQNSPRGQGEWCTGGQLCGRNPQTGAERAVLICTRCSWTWIFEPTVPELEFIQQSGMMGMAPPPTERLVSEG